LIDSVIHYATSCTLFVILAIICSVC